MKKNLIIAGIYILLVFNLLHSKENACKEIYFNFLKKNMDMIEMVGNFGVNGRIVFLPMFQTAEGYWTLILNLSPGYYYYRYRLNKEHWRLDPFITDKIDIYDGILRGRFNLLKVFPENYKEFLELSDKFIEENKFEWAKEVLIKAKSKFSKNKEIYKKLGRVCESLNNYKLAVDLYLTGIKIAPKDYEFKYKLALVYEKIYSEIGDSKYVEKAKDIWLNLIEVEEYKKEAKKHLKEL